jgi:hypothetical protein
MRGYLATVASLGSGTAAWLVTLDLWLKVGVELAGLVAGIYAIIYWKKKIALLETTKKPNNNQP